jgi:hypothetical protein
MGIFIFEPTVVTGNRRAILDVDQILEDPQDKLVVAVQSYWTKFRDGLNAFAFGMVFKAPGLENNRSVWNTLLDLTFTIINFTFPFTNIPTEITSVIGLSPKIINALRQDVLKKGSERAIANYYAEIVNFIGRPSSPEAEMLKRAAKAKELWIPMVRSASDPAAVVNKINQSVDYFARQVEATKPALFTQLFAEQFVMRFDGRNPNAWAGQISQGARRAGRLYLPLKLSTSKGGFTLDSIGKQWVLATTASKPEELAATLYSALALQNKNVRKTNLPRSYDIYIWRGGWFGFGERSIRASMICDARGKCGIQAYRGSLTEEQRNIIRRAWRDPKVKQARLGVNQLVGTNEYEKF